MKNKIMIFIEILLIIGVLLIMLFFKNRLEGKKKPVIDERDKIFEEISKEEYNKGTLLSVRYVDEQSDLGNTNSMELELTDNEITFTTKYSPEIGNPVEVIVFKVDKKDFEEIESLIKKYNIPRYNDFKDPEEHMLDGGVPHLIMFFDETLSGGSSFEGYSIDYEKRISTEGFNRLHEISDKLSKLKQDNKIIKEYTE